MTVPENTMSASAYAPSGGGGSMQLQGIAIPSNNAMNNKFNLISMLII